MPLLFNRLSRLVITFLPRSKQLLISWLPSPSAVILETKKIKKRLSSSQDLQKEMGRKPNWAGRAVWRPSDLTMSANPTRSLVTGLPARGVSSWGDTARLALPSCSALGWGAPQEDCDPWLKELKQVLKELTAAGCWTITHPMAGQWVISWRGL